MDDLVISSRGKVKINFVRNKLMENFVMKELGIVESYIGIDADYDKKKNF